MPSLLGHKRYPSGPRCDPISPAGCDAHRTRRLEGGLDLEGHPLARDAALLAIRTLLRDKTHRATTVGYGPRFLHSTGQLHKGGAPIGWFLQLVSEHPEERSIPGKAYTFGQLIDAQAIGDAQTIEDHKLPILRVNLGQDADAGLAAVGRALAAALKES